LWAKRPTGTSQLSGGGGLIADRRGVSVVEFALVAPMLLLLYLGGFELLQGIAIKRMVALTASTSPISFRNSRPSAGADNCPAFWALRRK
jgi:Flp pilus assembly protein TadG